MRLGRWLAGAALGGLALIVVSVPVFLLSDSGWAPALFAVGTGGVLGYLALTARSILREARTLKSSLGRLRRELIQEHAEAAGAASDVRRDLQEVTGALQGVLDPVRQDLEALQREVGRLRDAPASQAWRDLRLDRREGPCCLVMGHADRDSLLAEEDAPGRWEHVDPRDSGPGGLPAVPAHSVGAVLIDLDRFQGPDVGGSGWARYLRWLRTDVPVVGYTREPAQLTLRAATVSRLAGGVLLPRPVAADRVRFDRGPRPYGSAGDPAPRRAGAPS
ncbi:hypothetical protein [Microbacterium sp. A93]|uniref:hypothetical protein n=1 Tax=Microbacterium sp. A93 TaxID=3450716 RepID=UPI003F41FDB2